MLKLNTKDRNIWWSSDFHYYHKNICYGDSVWDNKEKNCRKFDTTQEMSRHIVEQINKYVKEDDLLIFLGDWSFSGIQNIWNLRKQLNVKEIIFITGNHDQHIIKNKILPNCHYDIYDNIIDGSNPKIYNDNRDNMFEVEAQDLFTLIDNYMEIVVDKTTVLMFHRPIEDFHDQRGDVIHLHGHCISKESEILTNNGWKKYNEIDIKKDLIYSDNGKNELALTEIKNKFIYDNYFGYAYKKTTRSADFDITDQHNMIYYDHKNNKKTQKANEFFNYKRKKIRLSGNYLNQKSCNLSDDLLKLYILIVADGSIKNETKLCRIRVKKEHKIIYIKKILNNLNINYIEHPQKDNTISFDFYLPLELSEFKFKGFDDFILNANKNDCYNILDAYENSDGNKNGKGTIIYSSKENEINILQQIFVINGFSANKHTRNEHGFSKNNTFQLSVYEREFASVVNLENAEKEYVKNGFYWCIETIHGNFFTRLNGKVYLTGNSHGNCPKKPRRLDVGIDNAFKIFGEYRPFNWEDIKKYAY